MASPVGGKNTGNGLDQLKAQIQAWIREEIGNALRPGVGLHIDGETGNLIVDKGEIQSDNYTPGSSGWGLTPDGNAEFNALTLRGGIIGNDALTNPTKPATIYTYATGFGLTTTLTTILSSTVTVPDGFTTAHVSVTGRVFAYNNTAALDYLTAQTNIAGLNGWALPLAVSGSGGSGTNISPFATILTGLTPGTTFAVEVASNTAFASWASNSGNIVEMSGSITWYR